MTKTYKLIEKLLEVAECYSDGRETFQLFENVLEEARDYLKIYCPKTETKLPTDQELCEYYTQVYYKSVDRQGPVAQAAALRAVLERWGKQERG